MFITFNHDENQKIIQIASAKHNLIIASQKSSTNRCILAALQSASTSTI
jgi:5-enolpyruvylshikimate-3-phosphate synthase